MNSNSRSTVPARSSRLQTRDLCCASALRASSRTQASDSVLLRCFDDLAVVVEQPSVARHGAGRPHAPRTPRRPRSGHGGRDSIAGTRGDGSPAPGRVARAAPAPRRCSRVRAPRSRRPASGSRRPRSDSRPSGSPRMRARPGRPRGTPRSRAPRRSRRTSAPCGSRVHGRSTRQHEPPWPGLQHGPRPARRRRPPGSTESLACVGSSLAGIPGAARESIRCSLSACGGLSAASWPRGGDGPILRI